MQGREIISIDRWIDRQTVMIVRLLVTYWCKVIIWIKLLLQFRQNDRLIPRCLGIDMNLYLSIFFHLSMHLSVYISLDRISHAIICLCNNLDVNSLQKKNSMRRKPCVIFKNYKHIKSLHISHFIYLIYLLFNLLYINLYMNTLIYLLYNNPRSPIEKPLAI